LSEVQIPDNGMTGTNIGLINDHLASVGLAPRTNWKFGCHFLDPNGAIARFVIGEKGPG